MSDFMSGLYINKKHDNAPDFVKFGIAINKAQLLADIDNYEVNDKGYIRLQVLESKDGSKWFAKIDNWKPSGESTPRCATPSSPSEDDEDEESLPF